MRDGAKDTSYSKCDYRRTSIEQLHGSAPPREVLRRHRVHLFRPEELVGLLYAAGLDPVEVAGDFDGSPLGPGSDHQVYRCRARR